MRILSTCILLSIFVSLSASIKDNHITESDTLYTELRNDVVVLSSTKETNSLKSLPAAVSVFSPKNLSNMQISSMKDLSATVPNFFVPDYGSKMSSPLYIRGIGARTGSQTVSMYVDNIPYFNTSTFDTELYDIQRVEVLRGTQGTLYGRNSMGGIINIHTFSPLDYQGTNASISAGNYGHFASKLSHYHLLTNEIGIAASGYYTKDDGFFKNTYTDKKADDSESMGGRLKLDWKITPSLQAQYAVNFDYATQGAFPYIQLGKENVDYNSPSSYKRRLTTNGINFEYTQPSYVIHSITGYQYLNDNMHMDQDYTPQSVFSINQRQDQHSLSQEFTAKSNTQSNYQWSYGIFGFYDYQKTTSPVLLLKDGIYSLIQKRLDQIPNPIIKITDTEINMDGIYKRPVYGGAVFHQSTLNNILFTKGLSLTAGLRLDYERTELKYNASTGTNMTLQMSPNSPINTIRVDSVIRGNASKEYVELLPKFVLKYEITPKSHIYTSISRGYKTGGHNMQLFADLLSSALTTAITNPQANATPDVNDMISFDPEYSWNFELGGNVEIIKNTLSTNFAFYYMDVDDVQITQFAKTGQGRMTRNAGKAVSKGFELGLKARPCKGFFLYANYGLADAKFKDYDDGRNNYTNNHIPFAPQQTVSFGTNITYNFKRNAILDQVTFDTNFSGAGKIYWTESNQQSQAFYGTMNALLSFEKAIFGLEFWGKNVLNRKYEAFYFESMNNSFIQEGKPAQWGATFRIKM